MNVEDDGELARLRHLLPVEEGDEIEFLGVEPASDEPVGARREARESALVMLYEAETRGVPPRTVLAAQLVPPSSFAAALVGGVDDLGADLDELIAEVASWTIDRMPTIDRCLLRLGAFELKARLDVPTGVVLSEVVELAGRYSTAESSKFVNGVLSRLAEDLRES